MDSPSSKRDLDARGELLRFRDRLRASDIRIGGDGILPAPVEARLKEYLQTTTNESLPTNLQHVLLRRFELGVCRIQFNVSVHGLKAGVH
jgi:hypothetical protein